MVLKTTIYRWNRWTNDAVTPDPDVPGAVAPGAVAPGAVAPGAVAPGAAGADNQPTPFAGDDEIPQYEYLWFPEDLQDTSKQRFQMKLKIARYRRNSIKDPVDLPPIRYIYLPIPDSLTDSQGVNYAATDTDPIVGAGIEAARSSAANGGSIPDQIAAAAVGAAEGGVVSTLRGIVERGGSVLGRIPIIGSILEGAVNMNSAQQSLQLNGLALNPFLTVLFQSPAYRQFQFTWKFAPQNERESVTLAKIVFALKNHMLPGYQKYSGGTLMTYPDVVTPEIIPNFGMNFKPCVIRNCSINYAPGGTPSFFKDNKPTMVDITLELQEIEYWLRDRSMVG